jgi:hypothetical protein
LHFISIEADGDSSGDFQIGKTVSNFHL